MLAVHLPSLDHELSIWQNNFKLDHDVAEQKPIDITTIN